VRSDNKYAEDGWARGRAGRASLATRNRNTKTIITLETVAPQTVVIMTGLLVGSSLMLQHVGLRALR
jgi:hypothetical protein